MAWTCSSTSNAGLVRNLKQSGYVVGRAVEEAMNAVDRKWFVGPGAHAYQDSPQSIGHNVTISAPHMHAHALSTLEAKLKPGARVLDVGSGSGYLTACMAHMVAPSGQVVGVEHVPELVKQSLRNIDTARAAGVQMAPIEGMPQYAPYDCVHVGAAAERFPQALLDQLAEGGLLYVPEVVEYGQQAICLYRKGPRGTYERDQLLGVRYVPLTSLASQLGD